ncbi:MAG TPA: MBL fold metallo-hydrolase [Labilithrix sp.]|jgi:ribonuclease BN (tRNA processing enzyme)
MKLYVLGVGDTFTEKHVTHSLLVEADGFRLAIDCPDSYRRVLKQARDKNGASSLDLFGIDDFLVTHVHGDHMNGLEGVGYFKRFAQQKRAALHTIAPVKETMWSERLAGPMGQLWNGTEFLSLGFDDYFAWSPLALDTTTQIGPFTVRARLTKHHVPTSALLLEHGGRKLGISSDTAFDPSLVEWLAEADLIVHETNYGPAHTKYEDLLRLGDDVKRKMRLIHYPDEFDVGASAIRCVLEGDAIEV